MDEQTLVKLIGETVAKEIKTELDKIRSEMATKEDLKAFATEEDFLEFERCSSVMIEKTFTRKKLLYQASSKSTKKELKQLKQW